MAFDPTERRAKNRQRKSFHSPLSLLPRKLRSRCQQLLSGARTRKHSATTWLQTGVLAFGIPQAT